MYTPGGYTLPRHTVQESSREASRSADFWNFSIQSRPISSVDPYIYIGFVPASVSHGSRKLSRSEPLGGFFEFLHSIQAYYSVDPDIYIGFVPASVNYGSRELSRSEPLERNIFQCIRVTRLARALAKRATRKKYLSMHSRYTACASPRKASSLEERISHSVRGTRLARALAKRAAQRKESFIAFEAHGSRELSRSERLGRKNLSQGSRYTTFASSHKASCSEERIFICH
jgi:hypothetical protein